VDLVTWLCDVPGAVTQFAAMERAVLKRPTAIRSREIAFPMSAAASIHEVRWRGNYKPFSALGLLTRRRERSVSKTADFASVIVASAVETPAPAPP
jgi:hypothetical protein